MKLSPLLKFMLSFRTKGMFRPYFQERTDGMADIVNKKGVNIKEGIRGHKKVATEHSK